MPRLTLFALGLALSCATASVPAARYALPAESAAAEQILKSQVPTGMSLPDALATMEKMGFVCVHVAAGGFADLASLNEFEFCERKVASLRTVDWWQAALLHEQGRIAEVRALFDRVVR